MIVDLKNTTTPAIGKKLLELRDAGGVVALGRVLTLLIDTGAAELEDAISVANSASRLHPSRIIVLTRAETESVEDSHLDAQIRVGGDAGASEVVVLTAHGEAASNQESLITGLLLPDAPVVAWWPGGGPLNPAASVLGRIASRRIVDSAQSPSPIQQLAELATNYSPGDGDMAWTRITLWRSQLAALMDQYIGRQVLEIEVSTAADSPSGLMLGTWLGSHLNATVSYRHEQDRAPITGIRGVTIRFEDSEVSIERDSAIAQIRQTGKPDGSVLLPPRTTHDCLVEDLRFLGEDLAFAGVLKSIGENGR